MTPLPVPTLTLIGRPSLHFGDHALVLDEVETLLFGILALDGPTPRSVLVADLWPASRSERPAVNLRQLRKKHRTRFGREMLAGTDQGSEVVALAEDVRHDLGFLVGGQDDTAAPPPGRLFGTLTFTRVRESRGVWIETWRDAVKARQLAARSREMHALEAAGRLYEALDIASELLREDPRTEGAYLLVARLQQRLGDRAGAARTLHACREMLRTEWNAHPGAAIRALESQLWQAPAAPAVLPAALVHPRRLLCRAAEQARIDRALHERREVVLEGEAGAGKSTLTTSLKRADRLLLRVSRAEVASPYGMLRQLMLGLRDYGLAACSDWARAELARVLPELGAPAPQPPSVPRLAAAVAEALVQAHASGLAAVLVDDAHESDAGSLDLLALVRRRTDRAPLGWLFACRSGDAPVDLQPWRAAADVETVHLGPFDAAATRGFLEGLDVLTLDAAAWSAALVRHDIGNPLQILQILIESIQRHGMGALAEPPALAAGTSTALRAVLARRIAMLSPDARGLAFLAALADGEVSVDLARAVLERPALGLVEAWAELESAQMLREDHLVHDALREALLEAMPRPIAIHQSRALAQAAAAAGRPAARVARYWQVAEAWPEAAAGFEHAADAASQANAWREAVRWWDEAAACHDQEGAGTAAFRARVRALDAASYVEPAGRRQERVGELERCARTDAEQFEARIARAGAAFDAADFTAMHAAALAALTVADRRADVGEPVVFDRLVRAVHLLALAESELGRESEGLQRMRDLAPRVEQEAGDRARLDYLTGLGYVATRATQAEASLEAFEAALVLAEKLDDWPEVMVICNNVASALTLQGNFPRAYTCARRAQEIDLRMGAAPSVATAATRAMFGVVAMRLGRFDEALAALQSAGEVFEQSKAIRWQTLTENHTARLYLGLGDEQRARACLRTPWPALDGTGVARRILEATCGVADRGAQRRQLQVTLDELPPALTPHHAALELTLLRLLPPQECLPRAQRIARESQTIAFGAAWCHARLVEAEALALLGRGDEAAAVVDDLAGTMDSRMPLMLFPTEAWLIVAEAYRAADRPADAAGAVARGVAWIEDTLAHVPEGWEDRFRTGHPANARLLADAARF